MKISLRDNHLACGLRLTDESDAYWIELVEDRGEEIVMRLRHKRRGEGMSERLFVMSKDTEYQGQPIDGPQRVRWEEQQDDS